MGCSVPGCIVQRIARQHGLRQLGGVGEDGAGHNNVLARKAKIILHFVRRAIRVHHRHRHSPLAFGHVAAKNVLGKNQRLRLAVEHLHFRRNLRPAARLATVAPIDKRHHATNLTNYQRIVESVFPNICGKVV